MENVIMRYNRLWMVCLLVSLPVISCAQTGPSKEYQIKAVFLFNFTQFIDWPVETFSTPEAPFVIGVLGKNPFGNYLDAIVAGEKIDGHPLVVKHFSTIESVKGCHILFISSENEQKLPSLLQNLKTSSTLTVGDVHSFTKYGGIIGFLTDSRKIRIQINLPAAQAADLSVSSKLLNVAEIVTEK